MTSSVCLNKLEMETYTQYHHPAVTLRLTYDVLSLLALVRLFLTPLA